MKRKLLLFFLIITLLLGTLPVVGATTSAPVEENGSAVNLLAALGIMDKDPYTGLFWNDVPVTRGEFAEIICRLYRYTPTTDAEKKFIDVSENKRAAVETVVRYGIMNGYGDGRFGEEDFITIEQLARVFAGIIGAKDMISSDYASSSMIVAKKFGLLDGISTAAGTPAKRIDVAQIIYNALSVDMVEVKVYHDDWYEFGISNGVTFLSEILDVYRFEGIVNKVDFTSNRRPEGADEGCIEIEGVKIRDEHRLADDYLGCSVRTYLQRNKKDNSYSLIYIESGAKNDVLYINGEDVISVAADKLDFYNHNDSRRNIRFNVNTYMVYNGKAIGTVGSNIAKIEKLANVELKAIDNNSDGVYDLLIVDKFTDGIFDKVNVEGDAIMLKYNGQKIPIKENNVRFFLDGERCELEDLVSGTVVSYTVSENTTGAKTVRIEACTDILVGEIASFRTQNGSTLVKIDETEYKVSVPAGLSLPTIKAGFSGQFYQNVRGDIVYYSLQSAVNVGFLIGIDQSSDVLQFMLFTEAGKVELFEAASALKINDTRIKTGMFQNDPTSNGILSDMEANVCGKQLVDYIAKDGKMLSVKYQTTPLYDKDNFSYDKSVPTVAGQIMCRKAGVINGRYFVNANTKVFNVPDSYKEKHEYYKIQSGTMFTRNWNSRAVKLYDVGEDGSVGYVLMTWADAAPYAVTAVGSPFLIVEGLGKKVDKNNEIVNVLYGYNKSGSKLELEMMSDAALKDGGRQVAPGDVIQYAPISGGQVASIKILEPALGANGDGIHQVTEAKCVYSGDYDLTIACGYVANTSKTNNILLSSSKPTTPLEPTDPTILSVVSNTSPVVYVYDVAEDLIEKRAFSDIELGDMAVALVSGNNSTHMLVIYR